MAAVLSIFGSAPRSILNPDATFFHNGALAIECDPPDQHSNLPFAHPNEQHVQSWNGTAQLDSKPTEGEVRQSISLKPYEKKLDFGSPSTALRIPLKPARTVFTSRYASTLVLE